MGNFTIPPLGSYSPMIIYDDNKKPIGMVHRFDSNEEPTYEPVFLKKEPEYQSYMSQYSHLSLTKDKQGDVVERRIQSVVRIQAR